MWTRNNIEECVAALLAQRESTDWSRSTTDRCQIAASTIVDTSDLLEFGGSHRTDGSGVSSAFFKDVLGQSFGGVARPDEAHMSLFSFDELPAIASRRKNNTGPANPCAAAAQVAVDATSWLQWDDLIATITPRGHPQSTFAVTSSVLESAVSSLGE